MQTIDLFKTRVGFLLGFCLYGLICFEMAWSYYKKRRVYYWKDTAANLGIFAGVRLIEASLLLLELKGLEFFYARTPLRLSESLLLLPLIFILTDFVYYWKHRFMHTVPALWAFHVVHHSSSFLNFTTSFRLNWFQALINFPFFIPLTLLGITPYTLLFLYSISAVYQFFVHTELVGHLGFLEHIFNTPSHHRVHHGKNTEYLNKNFGGVFIVWDKWFGTFAPEHKTPIYGITTPVESYNPVWLVMQGAIDWIRGKLVYEG